MSISSSKPSSLTILPYIITFTIWCIYVFITFSTPQTATSQATLNISDSQIFLIRLSVALPYLAMWMASVFGWLRVSQYAKSIKESAEGKAFIQIGHGLLFLAISLILTAIVSALRSYFIGDASVKILTTIFINYLYTIIPMIGFFLTFKGSRGLLSSIKEQIPNSSRIVAILPTFLFSAAYIWLTFTNPNRQIVPSVDAAAGYYLPDILIILTIIIPAIVAWIFGSLSATLVFHYQHKVQGVIYRQALGRFTYGFIGVVGSSIILQVLLSLGTTRLLNVGLGPLLAIIYVFLIVEALGFGFIAYGAKSLKKIEELR